MAKPSPWAATTRTAAQPGSTATKQTSRRRTAELSTSFSDARQLDGERRALLDLALDPDAAAVRFDDLPCDVEAETQPAEPPHRDGSLEAFEDPRSVFGRDPDPVILNRELRPRGVAGD